MKTKTDLAEKRNMIKFEIKNRWTGEVNFTAEIECTDGAPKSLKIGLAVKWGIKYGADLSRANLSYADLSRADLSDANLSYADLSYADLSRANLSDANLSDANLSYADLSRANLSDANLSYAKNVELALARTRILPDGDLIGWKKCKGGIIVKLRIPETAKRSHAFGRKCRAEYADVLEVIGEGKAISGHDRKTRYVVGQRVFPDKFDENWQNECASGIHFFITRLEAENY